MVKKQSNPVVSLKTKQTKQQQASEWLVYIDNALSDGELSREDEIRLAKWLAEDPEHAEILKQQNMVWSDLNVYAKALDNSVGSQQSYSWFTSWIFTRRLVSASLAFGVVAFGVCCFLLFNSLYDPSQTYVTNVGSQRLERLSDGSFAHLNTRSQIKVLYSKDKREIWLTEGEVLFDVAHDPNRPFIVHAHDRSVKAIGTEFVVRLSSDNILVTVTEGKVQFSKKQDIDKNPTSSNDDGTLQQQQLVFLEDGQAAEVGLEPGAELVLNQIDDDSLAKQFSWVNGRLSFENETLESIIHEISRYTPVEVIIKDDAVKSHTLSGRFHVGGVDALFEAIELSQPQISINRDGNVIYIEKK